VTFAVEGSLSYPSLLHVTDVGLVRVLLCNPLVLSHAPLLLRETMRIARKKALLYETGADGLSRVIKRLRLSLLATHPPTHPPTHPQTHTLTQCPVVRLLPDVSTMAPSYMCVTLLPVPA
jgi:hypothetical protein